MTHPMYCPACEEDFECVIKCMSYMNGTVDSSGEANTNIQISADCPTCGFEVISEFDYNRNYSHRLMQEANQDTHREVAVPKVRFVSKWLTHEEADNQEIGNENLIDNARREKNE